MSQDFSKYECPYSHIEKDCGHELRGPQEYENTYGVWCQCGFRGPALVTDPIQLKLVKLDAEPSNIEVLKQEMCFKEKPVCSNCANCSRYEKHENSPIYYDCEYSKENIFSVEEDDSCLKWEEV